MENIRKGNDIKIQWEIYAGAGINEAPYDLTGKNLSLFVRNQFGRQEVYDFSVDLHVLTWTFWGKDQKHTGTYHLELVENEGKQGMHTVDECDAFNLVSHSCETGGESEGRVECIHLQFRSMMSVGFPTSGGGADIVVDNVLSETSENPVQNKVVTSAINNLKTSLNGLLQSVSSLSEKVDGYSDDIADAAGKSDKATKAVERITEQISGIIEEVGVLSDKVKSLENGSEIGAGSVVMYVPQTLSEAQKTQARNNIGAVSTEELQIMYDELLQLIQGGVVAPSYVILDQAILDQAVLS